MTDPRYLQRCVWAEPTLFQAHPHWLAAENFPWTCRVDEVPRPILDTRRCLACDRRTPHQTRSDE